MPSTCSTWSTAACPSDMATGSAAEIEEERRLLYVAMTRAKRPPAPARAAALLRHAAGARTATGTCTRALTRFIPPAVAALFDVIGPAADCSAHHQSLTP